MPDLLRSATNGARGQLYFYGNIGNSMFGKGILASEVADTLKQFGNVAGIDIFISSYGGSPIEAFAIYNMLVRHRASIATHIDSIAASAASIVAMAGDTIHMAENATLMIHQAAGEVIGTADDMRKSADTLDTITQSIIQTYASRRGIDIADVREWVMAETWFDANSAFSAKMVDSITLPTKIAAFIPPERRAMFKHIPEALCNAAEPSSMNIPSESQTEPAAAQPEPTPPPAEFIQVKKRAAEIAALALAAKEIRKRSAPEDGRKTAEQ